MPSSRVRQQKMTGNSNNELLVKILRELQLIRAELQRANSTLNTSQ